MTGVKDCWHQLLDAILASNLPASDKAVARFLLDRADYKTVIMAPEFTPTEKRIGKATSISPRQVKYSIEHLAQHGWLEIGTNPQDRRRNTYTLRIGAQCTCAGRRHVADVADDAAESVSDVPPMEAAAAPANRKVQRRRPDLVSAQPGVSDVTDVSLPMAAGPSQKVADVADVARPMAAGPSQADPKGTGGRTGAPNQPDHLFDLDLAEKGATETNGKSSGCTQIGATDRCNAAGQGRYLTERQREGVVGGGIAEPESKPPACAICRTQPPGPGGVLCPQCRAETEAFRWPMVAAMYEREA